jgi:hypothetical protein
MWAEDLLEEQLAASAHLEIPPQTRLVKALLGKLPSEIRANVVLRKAFGFRSAPPGRSVHRPAVPQERGGCDYPYTYYVTKEGKRVAKTFDDELPDYFDMTLAVSNAELRRRRRNAPKPASYANIKRMVTKKEGKCSTSAKRSRG